MRALLMLAAVIFARAAGAQDARVPHAELPSAEQPVRRVPTTGYTLAISWAPEYCHAYRAERRSSEECRGARRNGFTLHGLWPDGAGANRWPQYCHPVSILSERQMQAGLSATPSRQLLQHEWAKHGACIGSDPVAYFREETRLFERLRFPDMAALADRRGLRAIDVQSAFAAANPGMRRDMMRINANRRGWLEEVWLCLGLDKRVRACPAEQGGAASDQSIRIQRPEGRFNGSRSSPWRGDSGRDGDG